MKKSEIKNKHVQKEVEKNKILQQIDKRYTDKEKTAIAEGGRIVPGYSKVPVIDFDGERIRFGVISDTHFGSVYTNEEHYIQALKEFKKERCEFIIHSGDVTEGMSNRPGHTYECNKLGYDAQKEYAIEMLSLWKKPMYIIDGNHDRWYIKSNGALIVKDICEQLPKAHYLGHDEGDISLKGKSILKLWHGEDGNSYAISYRMQKVVESLTGGEKPGMMLMGHTHKQGYFFERHVHIFGAGCIESQSKWMRGKRIAAHVGFWIVDVWVNKQGISKVRSTWYPFYG